MTVYHAIFQIGPDPEEKEIIPHLIVNVADEKHAAVLIDKAFCDHLIYLELAKHAQDYIYLKEITGTRFPEGVPVPQQEIAALEKEFLLIANPQKISPR